MSEIERLLRIRSPAQPIRGRKHSHPAGWSPGVRLGPSGGFVVTEPRESAPSDWDSILTELLPPGLDPRQYQVDGETVEVRAWDSNVGAGEITRLYYFKARVRIRSLEVPDVDLEAVIRAVKKGRVKSPAVLDQERAYFIHITDLQAGQADGDGVAGMVARVLELADLAAADLAMLKKRGTPASQIFVPVTGDLVEGISGWYEMQTFAVELDRRDQVKLVRRLLTEFLVSLASHGLPVHVAVVPGNHGENRKDGKAFTTLSDNDDLAVLEQIADAFALSEKHEHVTFSFPARDRLSLTVEVLGHIIGLTHGHLARGGNGTEGKILRWFERMAAVRDPIGDSDLIFSGHYHHARFQQLVGDVVWIQGGALCDASDWFSQSAGLVSDPVVMKGTITRGQIVESILPFAWQRSKPEVVKVSSDR